MVMSTEAARKRGLSPEQVARLNDIEQQLGWVQTWAAAVSDEVRTLLDESPVTLTVDEEVAAADSPTRVLKALEREFQLDRRTLLGRVERLVKNFQLERVYGENWSTNLKLFKDLAARDERGTTGLERGIASLDSKDQAQA